MGGSLRLREPANPCLAIQPRMHPIHVPARGTSTLRFRSVVSRLLVLGVLLLNGLGRGAEAAVPDAPQGMTVASGIESGPRAVPMEVGQGDARNSDSAPRAPRPDAARLGGGDCCRMPTCRCGCLYSVAAIAVAALGGRLAHA